MLAATTAGRRAIAPHQEKRRRSRRPPPCQGVAERTALRMRVGRLCCRAAWRAVVLLRREERCCRDVVVAAVDGRADGGRGCSLNHPHPGGKGRRRVDERPPLRPSSVRNPRPISFKRQEHHKLKKSHGCLQLLSVFEASNC
ncbi:uncharacterized protein [Triticum aestivum]|uniref:uncharacterized protein isoform X2 n=1 Tax=Triticum aestivum TaxID=4565 RepID=UPI001D02FB38|nr:uncharacterized protein LOC123071613 isoform X2 [Triticum aestivum]